MTPLAKRLTKPVIFTHSPEEQALLKAIDNELKSKKFSTFSELSKHALRQLLLPSSADMPLEQRITELETQLTALTERLVRLETTVNDTPVEMEENKEVITDPVLDRLRPLLEDF